MKKGVIGSVAAVITLLAACVGLMKGCQELRKSAAEAELAEAQRRINLQAKPDEPQPPVNPAPPNASQQSPSGTKKWHGNPVGNWKTYRLENGKRLTVTGQVKPDGTESFQVTSPEGTLVREGSATWEMIDDICYEKTSDGQWFTSSINWISENCYEITVLDSTVPGIKGSTYQMHRQ